MEEYRRTGLHLTSEEVESWMHLMPAKLYWVICAAAVLLIALIVRQFLRIPLKDASGNSDAVPLADVQNL